MERTPIGTHGVVPSKVKPLDAAEKRWLKRLESVLKDQPERLLMVECADSIMVVDRAAAKVTDLEDGKARAAGIVLADVKYSFLKLTGVSG